ncbi:MAG: LysM peptidoglycan-binding domain-containing protein [Chloroflexota bacterium]
MKQNSNLIATATTSENPFGRTYKYLLFALALIIVKILLLTLPIFVMPVHAQTSYTVKAGDNLTTIARRYKVTIGSIKQANSLYSDVIRVGQVLVIPGASSSTSTSNVSASNASASSATTSSSNTSASTTRAPAVKTPTPVATRRTSSTTNTQSSSTRTQTGTSSTSTSSTSTSNTSTSNTSTSNTSTSNTSTSNTSTSNTSTSLSTGSGCTGSTYIVKAGDTLYDISVRSPMATINTIKRCNGLTADWIRAGQTLVIPGGVQAKKERPASRRTPVRERVVTIVTPESASTQSSLASIDDDEPSKDEPTATATATPTRKFSRPMNTATPTATATAIKK